MPETKPGPEAEKKTIKLSSQPETNPNERKAASGAQVFLRNQPEPQLSVEAQNAIAAVMLLDGAVSKATLTRAEHNRAQASVNYLMDYINGRITGTGAAETTAQGKGESQ